jgi:hypothetical protein
VDTGARGIGVDRDTLSRRGCVRERVRIIMVQQPVTSHATGSARRTCLRNAAALQVISLRGIA